MNTVIPPPRQEVLENAQQKNCITYQHAGYQIRVHFSGSKTLIQCIKNLAEHKLEG